MSELIKLNEAKLKDFSMHDLFVALEYVEKMAEAARAKTGQILQYCKKTGIDSQEKLGDELAKLYEIFNEHNDLSFMIEREIDRRMKPKLKNKYGAKTLFDLGNKIDEKIRELFIEFKEKNPDQAENSGIDYK